LLYPLLIVEVGGFSLWQLANNHCGSWRFFVVTVGIIRHRITFLVKTYLRRQHHSKVYMTDREIAKMTAHRTYTI